MESDFGKYLNPKGGPVLIKTDMKAGEYRPINALRIATVLAYFIETTRSLQKSIYQTVGYIKNLLIETVSRVQGLTTDITIYIIPNASYHRSLEARLFNVATSRSKRHTIIIADENVINRSQVDSTVKRFLNKLDKDFSFFYPW